MQCNGQWVPRFQTIKCNIQTIISHLPTLTAAEGRRTQGFKQTNKCNNKTKKTKQQTNKCNNKTNKSAILQMWYATARPSCRNVRRTQGFLLQTCFRLRWGLLCYQVKTLSPARTMIRGPSESVFSTQCEQVLSKLYKPTSNLSFLSHFTCFVPFFLVVPFYIFLSRFFLLFVSFFVLPILQGHPSAPAVIAISANRPVPGSGSLPKMHQYINCYKTALLPAFTL